MARTQRPRSVEFSQLAEAVAGPLWAAHLSRALGVPERTLQRIREHAKAGREHPRAQECIDLLSVSLDALATRGRALRTRGGKREVERRYVRRVTGSRSDRGE
jgi:hypothetical protein